jgi:hypothetical protein
VITWGFVPDSQLDFVLQLREVFKFRWVWFGGDREAAHRHYTERGTGTEDDWVCQLRKIDTFIEPRMSELLPQRVDVFDEDGEHRPAADVWSGIVG